MVQQFTVWENMEKAVGQKCKAKHFKLSVYKMCFQNFKYPVRVVTEKKDTDVSVK